MFKEAKFPTFKFVSLWISIVILSGLLGSLSFMNRCGSTKVSIGADGWAIEASDCPTPMTYRDQPRID